MITLDGEFVSVKRRFVLVDWELLVVAEVCEGFWQAWIVVVGSRIAASALCRNSECFPFELRLNSIPAWQCETLES